jgi:hypothetical protein
VQASGAPEETPSCTASEFPKVALRKWDSHSRFPNWTAAGFEPNAPSFPLFRVIAIGGRPRPHPTPCRLLRWSQSTDSSRSGGMRASRADQGVRPGVRPTIRFGIPAVGEVCGSGIRTGFFGKRALAEPEGPPQRGLKGRLQMAPDTIASPNCAGRPDCRLNRPDPAISHNAATAKKLLPG